MCLRVVDVSRPSSSDSNTMIDRPMYVCCVRVSGVEVLKNQVSIARICEDGRKQMQDAVWCP